MKILFFFCCSLVFTIVNCQNKKETDVMFGKMVFELNTLLYQQFDLKKNDAITNLEEKMNLKLNSLKSIIFIANHSKGLKIRESDRAIIKERCKLIAEEFKKRNIHLLLLTNQESYFFQKVARSNDGKYDYLISNDEFKRLSKNSLLFSEIVTILDNNSRL